MDGRILRICGVNKSFSGVPVLKNAQLEVLPKEVHVLLGENEAGKSTLIKILSGTHGRESGDIWLDGRELAPTTLEEALDAGTSAIYQEFNPMPDSPMYKNVFIGREYGQGVSVDRKRIIKEAEGYMRWVGLEVSPRTLVRKLNVTQKRLVEVTKAISNHVKILVLDEPTAAIMDKGTDMLFGIIRELQKEKIGVIHISHRMNGLLGIGDRCTVMRDGECIGTIRLSESSKNELTKVMAGRMASFEKIVNEAADMSQVVLKAENLRYRDFLKGISFELYKGEILGPVDLVGADRTEAAKCMIGAYKKNGDTVAYKGETLSNNLSRNTEKGIVYLSEGRRDERSVLIHPVMDSTVLSNLKQLVKPLVRKKEMAGRVKDYIKSLQIRTHTRLTGARDLPRGSQQKVIIARWPYSNADIYIFDEPIRGADVGTRDEIYNIMYNLINQGASITMISSDLVEVLKVRNQVTIVREGVLEVILDNDLDLTQETILKYAMQEGVQV